MKSLTTSNSIFQATKLKTCTQQLKHDKCRNQANQEQLQPLFIMSPSDLLATPSSECLQERCSRHRHWETWQWRTSETTETCKPQSISLHSRTKQLVLDANHPSCVTRHIPPFKLTLDLWTQPYRLIGKQRVNLELTKNSQLFSRRHNRRIQVPLAPFSGVYPPVLARPLYLDVP